MAWVRRWPQFTWAGDPTSRYLTSRTLKDLGGTLSVDEAMAGILAGLDAGKHVVIPGFKAKLTYFCNRYLPDFIMNGLVDRVVRSVLDKMKTGAA